MDSETAAPLGEAASTIEPYEANPGPVAAGPPDGDNNKTVKTGYIVLKVDRDMAGGTQPFPALVVMNAANSDGQPEPVDAYNRPQAVKTLLTKLGISDSAEGEGDFVAIPVRSFQVMTRRLESSVTESVVEGSL